MSLIVVDVESDGPYPLDYSMVCFGAVIVDNELDKTFYGKTCPISNLWQSEALAISGFTRVEHLTFPSPVEEMWRFRTWLASYNTKHTFISDNPAFDWQFINTYFHKFTGDNPFGFSARRIGDLYCDMTLDARKNKEWKRMLRKTTHTHNPVDDAVGNAEALLTMSKMGLKGLI